jgi:hypothetical protein
VRLTAGREEGDLQAVTTTGRLVLLIFSECKLLRR